ncbi:hypothetical protein L0F63_006390, partial [Massospora cicadina]
MEENTISQTILGRKDKLIRIVCRTYGCDENDEYEMIKAMSLLEAEAYHFEAMLEKTAGSVNDLTETTTMSKIGLFTDVISCGMSFSPSANHVYLYSRKASVMTIKADGTKHSKEEKRLSYYVQFRGKRRRCVLAGSIKDISHIYVVREGDIFTHEHQSGLDKVEYVDKTNGVGRIAAGFAWITLTDGSKEFFKFYRSEMERLKGYSEKNMGRANDLYKSGPGGDFDLGFFKNKVGSHALNKYDQDLTPSAFEGNEHEAPADVSTDEEIPPKKEESPTDSL